MSLAVAAGLDWWWRPSHRIERAVAALSHAPRAKRFAAGRLTLDTRWAPAPGAERGDPAAASLDVLDAALRIEGLTSNASAPAPLYARALAEAASARIDEAIDDLRRALPAASGRLQTSIRSDLAALLLERGRQQDEPTDIVDALNEAGLAAGETPPAEVLFNSALALETLGPRLLATQAWERYLAVDDSSDWASEARRHLAAVRSRPEDSRAATTRRFHQLEHELLPAWARDVLARRRADAAPLTAAIAALAPATTDREALGFARAAVDASSGPSPQRACVARAIVALDRWLEAYDRVSPIEAEQAAQEAGAALACARLPVVSARIRAALVGDRQKVYEPLGTLATEAAALHYTRIASLARIARGNSAMRRAELTIGMSELRLARSIAYEAGDLELTSTADAMMADGYRELGDQSSAWRSLKLALENFSAAVYRRLVYSIGRAAAGAALDDGHSAASLPYSQLLIEATADWDQPATRILANLDRARALQTAGHDALARAAIETAAALVPAVADSVTRAEWTAEVKLARGRLEAARAPAAAIPNLSEALAFFDQEKSSVRMASVLLERGRAYRALGDPVSARRDWEAAASLVENQRPEVREAQLRISRFSALWDVFAELERASRSSPAESLTASERARARQLLDSLAPGQRSTPLTAPGLWSWLRPGDVAVEYSALPDELLVWTVDHDGPRLREVPIGAAALDVLVRRAVDGIRDGTDAGVDELSRLLLEGLPSGGPGGTLLIVPDGPLYLVPFAALRVPGTTTRLVERWTPVSTPSLSVARTLAERSQPRATSARVLLAGYSGTGEAGLPVLRGVQRELDAVKAVYTDATVIEGPAATSDAFLGLAAGSSIIHVAAHGVVNLAYPSRSYIQLAPGGEGGSLGPARIAAMKLGASPVVILSACDTGRGRVYRGEGQMSLARAFLVAGASSVVAAKYGVDDAVAPSLQAALHVRLARGVSGPEALAASQREAIGAGVKSGDWAVFTAIGSAPALR